MYGWYFTRNGEKEATKPNPFLIQIESYLCLFMIYIRKSKISTIEIFSFWDYCTVAFDKEINLVMF